MISFALSTLSRFDAAGLVSSSVFGRSASLVLHEGCIYLRFLLVKRTCSYTFHPTTDLIRLALKASTGADVLKPALIVTAIYIAPATFTTSVFSDLCHIALGWLFFPVEQQQRLPFISVSFSNRPPFAGGQSISGSLFLFRPTIA